MHLKILFIQFLIFLFIKGTSLISDCHKRGENEDDTLESTHCRPCENTYVDAYITDRVFYWS